jgi:hypothetical protein
VVVENIIERARVFEKKTSGWRCVRGASEK